MPPMPGSALVVIEPELVFCGLKTVLDRPPMAFDRHQCFDRCSCWTPGGEEGEIAIGDMTTDQQTACPQTLICAVEFFGLEIGQFEITPIMQPRSFGSGPCRQAFPVGRAPRPGDVRGRAGDGSPLAPGLKHMRAADPEYIAFACPTQLLLDIANTVDGVTSNPFEWYRRGHGGCDHSRRELWFGRKADIGGHVCGFQAIRIVGPFLRKIQRTVDERVTVARNVGSEDPDLAVRDLACGAGILPRNSARRLALLEKAGLVDHEDRIVIRQMLDDIIAYDIAQGIRIPIHAAQDRLLPPGAGIASRLGAHPTSLALLISEQAFQEQAGIRRNALLSEQRTYPLLDLPKRRRPLSQAGQGVVRSGAAIYRLRRQDHELPDRGLRCLRFAPRSCVHRPYAVSSEGMDRRSGSPGSRIRAPRCRLCDQTKARDANDRSRHGRVCTIQMGCW